MKLNKTLTLIFALVFLNSFAQKQHSDIIKTKKGLLKVYPVLHASLVLEYNGKTIYVDPHGKPELYKGFSSPDIVLITDIHGDHLNLKTLEAINTSKAAFIVPLEVSMELPEKYQQQVTILNNGQGIHRLGFFIQAIAMYNLPEHPTSRHPKGRGNGYLLNFDDKRVYISGDTEDIIEMRMLQDIDIAFVCMNQPYTMDINQAADAVLEFQPKLVYPYHFRGKDGFSDVAKFKELVNSKNRNIEVRLLKWYP
jgi:L-ascorbate metabolism protein UlaG (beta-lactamase superfamily)